MNLLSQSAKIAWKRSQRRRAFMTFSISIFVLEVLLSTGMFLVQSQIRNQTKRYQQEVNSTSVGAHEEKQVPLTQKTKQLNARLAVLKRDLPLDYPWAGMLHSLDAAAPSTIRFHSLSMNLAKHSLTLSGFAGNRDDFIAFQQALTALPTLSGVNSPITNLLKRENIEFTITATFSAPTS